MKTILYLNILSMFLFNKVNIKIIVNVLSHSNFLTYEHFCFNDHFLWFLYMTPYLLEDFHLFEEL